MKTYLKLTFLFLAMGFAHYAMAYEVNTTEEVCKKPKFSSFSLSEYKGENKEEVAGGSEFSFTISSWIDPTTIKLSAKKKPLTFKVEDKKSFYLVHSQLPTEYAGQFLRLDVQVHAKLGCKGLDGWLVKVKPE